MTPHPVPRDYWQRRAEEADRSASPFREEEAEGYRRRARETERSEVRGERVDERRAERR